MKKIFLLIFLLLPSLVQAQTSRNPCYNTGQGTGINGSTNCIGVGTNTPLPVTLGGGTVTVQGNVSNATSTVAPTSTNVPTVGYNYVWNGTSWDQAAGFLTGAAGTANSLSTILNSQYPINSVTTSPTPVGAVASGTTGAVVATMSATASVTNYLCDVEVSAIGGTASIGPIVIAGLTGGSRTVQLSSSATGALYQNHFSPCLAASAANTAITITTTADGTATAVDVNAGGYRL